MQLGKLFVVSAPSGGGKTKIIDGALGCLPEFTRIVTCTTRERRGTEVNGTDYHFLTLEEFVERRKTGFFLEWNEVYAGRFYGTPIESVREVLQRGENAFLNIDIDGAAQVRGCPDTVIQKALVTLFIKPPDLKVLEKRLRERGTDSEEGIQERLKRAPKELAQERFYKHVIMNDVLENAITEFVDVIQSYLVPA